MSSDWSYCPSCPLIGHHVHHVTKQCYKQIFHHSQEGVTDRHGQSYLQNAISDLKIFCMLQVFSSLVVNTLLLVTRLSCIFHHQGRHALCPHYLTTERVTLFPMAASSVADMTLTPGTAAYSGHQTRAPGRRLSPWMSADGTTSPGLQAAATTGHTSWEVATATARRQLH